MAEQFNEAERKAPSLDEIVAPDINAYNPNDIIAPDPTKPGAIDLPLPGAGAPALSTVESRIEAISNWKENTNVIAKDPLAKTKVTSFGAGMDDHQFERYYNMSGVYNKLGFSPFRDNETAYNKESNFFDELGRTTSQWASLAGLGGIDAAGFGSITDTDAAKDYQKAVAIASSSKGGVGGFVNNLYLNSGYSVGILAEVMLEEVGLALITGATMGAASEVTIPAMIARGLRAGNKLHDAYKVSKNIVRTTQNLKDINKARKYFKRAIDSGGKFLNPLENTTEFMQGISNVEGLNKMAKTTMGFASFYKDIRNIRYAWGESGLEGGMVKRDMEAELLEAHYDKYDRPPSHAESQAIKDTATRAGATVGWQNLGAIYFSNKIVLDGLFNAYKPLKNLTADALDDGMFKTIKNAKKKVSPFETVENNFKQKFREFKNPKKSLAIAANYFKANIAEGFQESAQETISGAAMDYYKSEWEGNTVKGGYYASIADNLKKQTTAEGVEVFMSGFLMGGMISPIAGTMGSMVPGSRQQSYIKNKWKQFKDPTGYAKMKKEKEDYVNKTTNTLNELWDNVGDKLAPELDNLNKQEKYAKGMKQAQDDGDGKAFYDLKNDGQYSHIYTALRHGSFDNFVDELAGLKQLSAEEVKEKYKVSKEEYDSLIDSSISRAKQIEARYEVAQTEFKNPFNKNLFIGDKDAYIAEAMNEAGWQQAQEQFIFLQHSFDSSLTRFNSIMGEAQADANLKKVPATDFNTMFHIETMDAEISRLDDDIASMKGMTTPESKKLLKQKEQKRELLSDFAAEMEEIRKLHALEGTENAVAKDSKAGKAQYNKAKKAYTNYLRHLAKVNDTHAFNNALDKSFAKLVDAYELNATSGQLTAAINKMLDPGTFTRIAGENAEINRLRKAQQQEEIRSSLEAYVAAYEGNMLLEGLYEMGVFFDHEQFEQLILDGQIPENFKLYEVPTKPGAPINEVEKTSEVYTQAMNVILEFVPGIMGIPLSQAASNRAQDVYNNDAREKMENDERTYADLAKQFGFDPKSTEAQVPVRDVLTAVSTSDFATAEEKALAKQLLKRASAEEFVTFVNNAESPGTYSNVTQTTIDARYSAHNYADANFPIESIILRAEVQRRTVNQLENDPQFAKDIGAIHKTVAEYMKDNGVTELMFGMSNLTEFINEAMTNPRFQELLASVEYTETGKSAWKGFVRSVIATMKKFFGGKKVNSGTALNEALHLITAKIDATYGIKNKKVVKQKPGETSGKGSTSSKERTESNTKISNAMPLSELQEKHPELAARLLQLFIDNHSDPDFTFRDEDYATKDVANSVKFDAFYKSPSESVQKIIDEYNVETERTVEPLLAPYSATNIGEAIRARLKSLGYTDVEIADLGKNVATAVKIANDNIKKTEREAKETKKASAAKERDAKTAEAWRAEIHVAIEEATTFDTLNEAQDNILAWLDEPAYENEPGGPTVDALLSADIADTGIGSIGAVFESMIAAKLEQIAGTVTMSEIVPGNMLILNNNAQVIVEKVTSKGKILVRTLTSKKAFEVKLKDVKFASPEKAKAVLQKRNAEAEAEAKAISKTSLEGVPENDIDEDVNDSDITDEDDDVEIC